VLLCDDVIIRSLLNLFLSIPTSPQNFTCVIFTGWMEEGRNGRWYLLYSVDLLRPIPLPAILFSSERYEH